MILFHNFRNFELNRLVYENGKPSPVPPILPPEEKPPLEIPRPDPSELDELIDEAQDVFKNAEKAARIVQRKEDGGEEVDK